jgi:hypothetical protein
MLSATNGPSVLGLAVSANDTITFTTTKSLYVGVSGNVKVQFGVGYNPTSFTDSANNTFPNVTFQNVPAGTFLPLKVNKVFATGTTANSFVAIY